MDLLTGLPLYGLHKRPVVVAKAVDGNACEEIYIFLSINIPQH